MHPWRWTVVYEGDKTRGLAETLRITRTVPPKANRKGKWHYDRELYKLR